MSDSMYITHFFLIPRKVTIKISNIVFSLGKVFKNFQLNNSTNASTTMKKRILLINLSTLLVTSLNKGEFHNNLGIPNSISLLNTEDHKQYSAPKTFLWTSFFLLPSMLQKYVLRSIYLFTFSIFLDQQR